MAMTREYLDIVEDAIDIAPVGSQEEVQAAEFMLDAFTEHGLETELQDLSAPLYSRLITGVILMLTFAGAVFCGLGGFGWAALGFIMALVFGVYLGSEYLGMNPIGAIGPTAESQNVIGIHRGEGARAGRGVRPIVVLARYDTGREELLAKPPFATVGPLAWQVAPWCVGIVMVGTLLQLFQIMGEPALIVLWIITMVCALPLLLLGANEITAPFMSLTDGANDNKASLAAMLGVLEDVVPSDEERIKVRAAQMARARAEARREAEDEPVEYEEYEEVGLEPVIGVRHGRRVLESIGMLPATCEISYLSPKTIVTVKRRPKPRVEEDVVEEEPRPGAGATIDMPVPGEVAVLVEGEASPDVSVEEGWGESDFEPGVSKRRALLFDLPDPTIDELDPLDASDPAMSRTTMVVEDVDDLVGPTIDVVGESEVVEAEGGRPGRRSRRGGGRGSRRTRAEREGGERRQRSRRRGDDEVVEVEADGRDVVMEAAPESLREKIPFLRSRHQAGADELIEEDFSEGGDDWMGGATPSARMREILRQAEQDLEGEAAEGEALADEAAEGARELEAEMGLAARIPTLDLEAEREVDVTSEAEALASLDEDEDAEEEPVPDDLEIIGAPADDKLRQAVLDMGDVNLVAHDIWFVCVGASSLRHTGTQAFVQAHRRELRGCFVINLDSVGAGALTLLTTEGYGDTRRGDRKISRLFDTAAKALHVPLSMNEHNWEDTDVTPALRRSMRGITLMGTENGKIRALANTPDDVYENLMPDQVVHAAELVSEVIRRA